MKLAFRILRLSGRFCGMVNLVLGLRIRLLGSLSVSWWPWLSVCSSSCLGFCLLVIVRILELVVCVGSVVLFFRLSGGVAFIVYVWLLLFWSCD